MGLTEPREDEIIDIDLSITQKKKFRINGDNSKIIELNTSDTGIIKRLSDSYEKLKELSTEGLKITASADKVDEAMTDETDEEEIKALNEMGEAIASVDKKMRDILDFVFDSNVSEVCAPEGTMFDLFNGTLRYEHIIEVLSKLYADNITKEIKRLNNKVAKHTKKYSNKKR